MNADEIIEQKFRNEIKENLKNIPQDRYEESQGLMFEFSRKCESIDYKKIFEIKCENREWTLIKSAMFLFDYEAKFAFCVNLTYFLCFSNCPENSFKEIQVKGISYKMAALAKKGFKTFEEDKVLAVLTEIEGKAEITLKSLREFRNTIGHFNFLIEDDGRFIELKDNKKREIHPLAEHSKLLDCINGLITPLKEFTNIA